MTAFSAGVLRALVRFRGREVDSVELQLQRPLQALAGFRGKPPADCLRLLPLLFPLCGTAHALAALRAIEMAASVPAKPAHAVARNTLALADSLAAQIWRTCIDWAQLGGTPVEPQPVAQARRLVEQIALAVYPDGDWKRIGGGRLAPAAVALSDARQILRHLRTQIDLAGALEQLRAPMLRAMSDTEPAWIARLDHCFVAMAEALEASFQTLDAHLQTLAAVPETPPATARNAARIGHGSGTALTARGELYYEFEIDSVGVVACRVSAPTDRAFATDGPVAQLLRNLRQANDPLLAVRWVLAAHDPCIEVRVERAGE